MEDSGLHLVLLELEMLREELARDGRQDLADRVEAVRLHLCGKQASERDLFDAIMLVIAIIGLWK